MVKLIFYPVTPICRGSRSDRVAFRERVPTRGNPLLLTAVLIHNDKTPENLSISAIF